MASFSFEDALEPAVPKGHPQSHAPVRKGQFSFEDAAGGEQSPSFATSFMEHVKNPLTQFIFEGAPANIIRSIKNHEELWKKAEVSRAQEAADKETLSGVGQFSNNPRAVAEAKGRVEQREAARPTVMKMWEEAKKDWGKTAAEFVNAISADPWILFSGFAGAPGGIATRLATGAAASATTNVGIEAAREQATEGRVRPENMVAPAQIGVVLGGGTHGAFGSRGPRVRVTDPKQLFPDDAAHAAFEDSFRKPREPGTAIAAVEKPRVAPQEIIEPGSREWAASDTAKALGLAGLGTGLLALEDQDEAALMAMAAGGIKAKGGMWHPEAIKRLSQPLTDTLARGVGDAEAARAPQGTQLDVMAKAQEPIVKWGEDRVSKYLNRYAGTADDPLKDIKLPSGKTWEEVTDAVMGSAEGRYFSDIKAAKLDEPVFDVRDRFGPGWNAQAIEGNRTQYLHELTSHLSHVGDYLRQNVSPDKLPQYDLVRAVKETAKNDERVAKEMEKSRAASTASLPVHKEYPESGMKWVELKLPDELTSEQLKGIREAKEGEASWANRGDDTEGEHSYIALDSKGKPIKNSYTESLAGGSTPEEAWLAGRLAEEGNTMGHCVGGYCEGVASGESRIFSLRDKKGESHVTVEVRPESPMTIGGMRNLPEAEQARIAALPPAERGKLLQNPDILQIKGKQNRAPDSKYLPFVQDFVKGGKWGEVGDLEGTGLVKGSKSGYNPHRLKELDPEAYYTKAELEAIRYRDISFKELKDELALKHPSVSTDLREGKNGAITLANIELKPAAAHGPMIGERGESIRGTKEGERPVGRGYGQAAIKEITSYADANNRGMLLSAAGVPDGPPTPKLVEIYKRYGFEEAAYQPFPDIAVNMYRNPKGGTSDVSKAFASPAEETVRGVQEASGGGAGRDAGGMGGGEVPPERRGPGFDQKGNVDKRLLFGLTAAGLGGALGAQLLEDEPIRGMLWGAALTGALPFLGKILKTTGELGDIAGGMLSTRMRNISKPLEFRAQMHAREEIRDITRYGTAGIPFLKEAAKFPELRLAITDNNPKTVRDALIGTGSPAIQASWTQLQKAVKEIGEGLKSIGRLDTVLDGYFPRVVKDPEGLFKHLEETYGKQHLTELQKRLKAAEEKFAPSGGLTEVQRSKVINDYLRYVGQNSKPGFSKGRTIKSVTEEMLPFYHDLPNAWEHYVGEAVRDIAKARFFGKDAVKEDGVLNVDKSAGRILDKELEAGKISFAQAEEARGLINSYLGPKLHLIPNTPAGKMVKDMIQGGQNITYAALLGNVVSAGTQALDQGLAIYANGLFPTMRAVGRKMTGKMKFDLEESGLVNHISDEFATRGKTAAFLNHTFKYGFALLDRLGKSVLGEGAYIKYADMVKTEGGRGRFAKEYGEAFGDSFPQLMDDLKAGKTTDLTQALTFLEIARRHPISRLEAPEWYNRVPDLRPALMLKRYMLKQYDVLRRDAYDEWRAGNRVKGTSQLLKYGTTMALMGIPVNMVIDWMENKPMQEDDWMPRLDTVLKTFGASEYVLDQVKQGHPLKAAAGVLAPPIAALEDVVMARKEGIKKIPGIGRLLYGHLFEEEVAKKEEKKQLKRERANDDAYQEMLKERRRQRKELRGY